MFLVLKNLLIIILFLFIYGCASENSNIINNYNINSVSIETKENKYNILFKENLKRIFRTKDNTNRKFLLKASITFSRKSLNFFIISKDFFRTSLIFFRKSWNV
jgi:hypothetical protein